MQTSFCDAAVAKSTVLQQHRHKYLNLPAVGGGGAVHPHRGVQDREEGGQLLMQEPDNKGQHCGHPKKTKPRENGPVIEW
jgi:hypothetical protein